MTHGHRGERPGRVGRVRRVSAGLVGFWLVLGGPSQIGQHGFRTFLETEYGNIVFGLMFPVVGALILSRVPGHRLGWLYCLCRAGMRNHPGFVRLCPAWAGGCARFVAGRPGGRLGVVLGVDVRFQPAPDAGGARFPRRAVAVTPVVARSRGQWCDDRRGRRRHRLAARGPGESSQPRQSPRVPAGSARWVDTILEPTLAAAADCCHRRELRVVGGALPARDCRGTGSAALARGRCRAAGHLLCDPGRHPWRVWSAPAW